MTTTTRQDSRLPEPASNEAAERLRDWLKVHAHVEAQIELEDALTAERRATIQTIQDMLRPIPQDGHDNQKLCVHCLRVFLDEEAAHV